MRQFARSRTELRPGFVNWVGTSSMEVQIQAHSLDAEKKKREQCFRALFSMVALDSVSRRPCAVNKLAPETPEEKTRYRRGAQSRAVCTDCPHSLRLLQGRRIESAAWPRRPRRSLCQRRQQRSGSLFTICS